MTFDEAIKSLGMKVDETTARACRYLESAGYKFCVHFGVVNAVGKAQEHWRARRKRKKSR